MMFKVLIIWLFSVGSVVAQEATKHFGPQDAAIEIRLRTTTDIEIFAPTVVDFLSKHPDFSVHYEQWGSNDLYEKTSNECASKTPSADIVISSAVHQMVKLVNDRCAAPWNSDVSQKLMPELSWRNEIWGITSEPAVMVYNKTLVSQDQVPYTRFDLLDLLRPQDNEFAGRVATYDIEASGLGFLFAFLDSQEASTFGALMEAFARSGAVATCCSSEIINGVIEGRYLIAYNVLGSYANTIAKTQSVLGIIEPQDYTLVLSRAAILPGRNANRGAGLFLEYLLSDQGQAQMSEQFLVTKSQSAFEQNEPPATATRRIIELGPALLVAEDQATVRRFNQRWHDIFSTFDR
jgi:iron(III) transport system substrate-binding protein